MINEELELINLTDHGTVIEHLTGKETIDPSGKIARVYFEQDLERVVNGIPVYRNVNGWIKGLPKPRFGIGYIVSGIVFQNTLRPDVFTPNTQPWSTSHKTYGKVASVKSLLGVVRKVA